MEIKDLSPRAKSFIYDSLMKSYRFSPHFKTANQDKYVKEQQSYLDYIMNEADTRAYLKMDHNTDPKDIICYILMNARKNLLHYVYTPIKYRSKGLAKELILWHFPEMNKDNPIRIDHYTKAFKYFAKHNKIYFDYQASLRYQALNDQ